MLVALNISRNLKIFPPLLLLLLANLLAGLLQLLFLRQLVGEETLRQVSNLFRVASEVDGADGDEDEEGEEEHEDEE